MKNHLHKAGKGSLVARILAGSWRHDASKELLLSESELDEVTPLLYGSGAGALGWWRVRESELRSTKSATVLQKAYQLQVLQAKIHEEKIQKVVLMLREASIEPV